jgi:hypothetical protein
MAIGSNIITDGLSGTLGGLVFVNSKRYPPHTRRKRGTVKPATLNAAMEKSSHRMALANLPAKAIFDAVRDCHKDGELWNKLIIIFRRQLKAGKPFGLNDLQGLECHDTFTLRTLMCATGYTVSHLLKKRSLCVKVFMNTHPSWSHLDGKIDFQYRLSVVAVFPDIKTGRYTREIIHGPVTGFSDPVQPVPFNVPLPDYADGYVLFLAVNACQNGEVLDQMNARGMQVVGTGAL